MTSHAKFLIALLLLGAAIFFAALKLQKTAIASQDGINQIVSSEEIFPSNEWNGAL